jgi:autotransporter strand-loop-strand O-heptosyltransferase
VNIIKYNYRTTLPKIANAPSVEIEGNEDLEYLVSFYVIREDKKILMRRSLCRTGQIAYSNSHQWFDYWYITVHLNNDLISEDTFDPNGKIIFVKMDGRALGDNIAWIQSVEEFRKKHNCTILCSTFFNDIFKDVYPEIIFLLPNTQAENVYAQYYIGAHNDDRIYSPRDSKTINLQYVATDILGLEEKEIVPNLMKSIKFNPKVNIPKYVCISERGSAPLKEWKDENGWQKVVDYLNSKGYKVVVISKEPTTLENVIDLTGDKPLKHRMIVLSQSEFFMGVSSGLSWLAWGCSVPVIMISDCTPRWHEFSTKMFRISKNNLDKVDYDVEDFTTGEEVIDKLRMILEK